MFKRTISDEEMALQISGLLNKHSKLSMVYSPEHIYNERNSYIVETIGQIVVGCVQVEKQAYALSEIKHLVVRPEMRGRGIARSLVGAALNFSATPLAYATIRKENLSSQAVFRACGFINASYYTTGDRDLLMFVATSPKWKKQVATQAK